MIRSIISIIIAAAAVALPAVASAQPAATPTTFGFKAGINFASMAAEDSGESLDFDTKTALAVTGFAQAPIAPGLSLRPEIGLSQRGGEIGAMGLGVEGSVDFDMLYADANLLVVATLPIEGDVKPYVVVGPSLGLLLSAETTIDFGGVVETEDFKDDVNDVDVSVVAGGGVDIPTSSGAVGIELRYQHGLRNLLPEDEAADGDSITHRVFSIHLGYAF